MELFDEKSLIWEKGASATFQYTPFSKSRFASLNCAHRPMVCEAPT